MKAAVFGSATLDVICQTVDEVPRHASLSFDQVTIAPGGCASNVAVGLAALGVPTGIVARLGADDSAQMVRRYWERVGLDARFVQPTPDIFTAVSVGLVDSQAQPRFVHTPGANGRLTAADLDAPALAAAGVQALHVGGYFVLPGLLDERFPPALRAVREQGILITLDVVRSPRMNHPAPLFPCLPEVDIFLCNEYEALHISGEPDAERAAAALRAHGANSVIVKLGERGCWVEPDPARPDAFRGRLPGLPVERVVDTTGAGDAFAAGLVAALLDGSDLEAACRAANAAGARSVQHPGPIACWL